MELQEKISSILSYYNITKYEFAKRLGHERPETLYSVNAIDQLG